MISSLWSSLRAFYFFKVFLFFLFVLFFEGCVSSNLRRVSPEQWKAARLQVKNRGVPSSLETSYTRMIAEGKRNLVLNAMQCGLQAIRSREWDIAEEVFDQAIREVETLQEGSRQARRAKSKFVAEEEKFFKGESYERAALYLYRSLLYARDGDFNNSAASARRAQLQDISENPVYSGDWASGEWLTAYAYQRSGYEGGVRDALRRMKILRKEGEGSFIPPRRDGNLLVIVEAGSGPQKMDGGRYGEKIILRDLGISTYQISVGMVGKSARKMRGVEDIYFQAATRGKRRMDEILEGKAAFKKTTSALGKIGILAGAKMLSEANKEKRKKGKKKSKKNRDVQELVGAGLLLGGVVSSIFSASTRAEVDLRAWSSLPHSLFFYTLKIPRGSHTIVVKSWDREGSLIRTQRRKINITDKQKKYQLWIQMP